MKWPEKWAKGIKMPKKKYERIAALLLLLDMHCVCVGVMKEGKKNDKCFDRDFILVDSRTQIRIRFISRSASIAHSGRCMLMNALTVRVMSDGVFFLFSLFICVLCCFFYFFFSLFCFV